MVLWRDLIEKERLKHLSIDEKIILQWILKSAVERHGLDLQVAGACECDNEFRVS
jgi:hypothetical protein